jgi:hypothetical protein
MLLVKNTISEELSLLGAYLDESRAETDRGSDKNPTFFTRKLTGR